MATDPEPPRPHTAQPTTPRPALFAGVPDSQWNDWRWQLKNRLNSLDELASVIQLTPEEAEGARFHRFRVDITPYFASLLDPTDPTCPIRRQVIPTARELEAFQGQFEDSLAEDAHSPVPGLVHRYPDRVLMLVTTQCASYCRYCTRSRIVGDPAAQFSRRDYDAQLDYLARTPEVRDVLLSGGDPLILPPKVLEGLLRRLREIPHIEIVRIGTRVPLFLPQRIDEELVAMLRQFHPLWVNIHFNHAREMAPEVAQACARLADAGIPLGAQTVLLAGVNDTSEAMQEMVHTLVRNRIRPYYLYQCDLVQGAGHFRTPVSKGIEIMESLRGHTSGYAVPTYVVDAPGGGGKIPVGPTYLISQAPNKVVLRNYEGFITTYDEPTDYVPPAPRVPGAPDERARQAGVAGLLDGSIQAIKPEGFDSLHERHQRLTHVDWAPIQEQVTGEVDPLVVTKGGEQAE